MGPGWWWDKGLVQAHPSCGCSPGFLYKLKSPFRLNCCTSNSFSISSHYTAEGETPLSGQETTNLFYLFHFALDALYSLAAGLEALGCMQPSKASCIAHHIHRGKGY